MRTFGFAGLPSDSKYSERADIPRRFFNEKSSELFHNVSWETERGTRMTVYQYQRTLTVINDFVLVLGVEFSLAEQVCHGKIGNNGGD